MRRLRTASLVVCLLLTGCGVRPAAGPVKPGKATAQPPATAKPPATTVEAALARQVDWTIGNLPLHDFAALVARDFGIPVEIDQAPLQELGIPVDSPISITAQGISLERALQQALRPLQLTFRIDDGRLVITSTDPRVTTLRRYDVGRLLERDMAATAGEAGEQDSQARLGDLLARVVFPNRWESLGGSGTWHFDGPSLVVRQDWQTQREVETLLAQLETLLSQSPADPSLGRLSDEDQQSAGAAENLWRRPVNWSLRDESLKALAHRVGQESELDAQVDVRSLQEVGISPDKVRVQGEFVGVPLGQALALALAELDLTWILKANCVLITMPDSEGPGLSRRVYDVRRLLDHPSTANAWQVEDLMLPITTATELHHWEDVGGDGVIVPFAGLLVICQTEAMHQKISRLLQQVDAGLQQPADQLALGPTDVPSPAPPARAAEKPAGDPLAALARPIDWDLDEQTSLRQFADALRREFQINVFIDRRSLDEVGLGSGLLKLAVARRLKGISLRLALWLVLRDLELTYTIDGPVLVITTPDAEQDQRKLEVYNLRPLLAAAGPPAEPGSQEIDIIELVTSIVRPNSWEERGGPGALHVFKEQLIVNQTLPFQREIGQLLKALEQALRAPAGDPAQGIRMDVDAARAKELAALFRQPVDWSLTDVPLSELVARLRSEFAGEVAIDHRALDELNLLADQVKLTGEWKQTPLDVALPAALKEHQLALLKLENLLWITTANEAENHPTCRLYDIRRLLPAGEPLDPPVGEQLYRVLDPQAEQPLSQISQLCNRITSQVQPKSWEHEGGRGVIRTYRGLLVISQSDEAQQEISELLRKRHEELNPPKE